MIGDDEFLVGGCHVGTHSCRIGAARRVIGDAVGDRGRFDAGNARVCRVDKGQVNRLANGGDQVITNKGFRCRFGTAQQFFGEDGNRADLVFADFHITIRGIGQRCRLAFADPEGACAGGSFRDADIRRDRTRRQLAENGFGAQQVNEFAGHGLLFDQRGKVGAGGRTRANRRLQDRFNAVARLDAFGDFQRLHRVATRQGQRLRIAHESRCPSGVFLHFDSERPER